MRSLLISTVLSVGFVAGFFRPEHAFLSYRCIQDWPYICAFHRSFNRILVEVNHYVGVRVIAP